MYVRAQIVSCTHIYLLFGVVLWNASALPGNIFRTRWLVHFPVYPTPPSPGWSRGASTYGPDFPESSYSLPPPLSLSPSLENLEVDDKTRAVLFEQRVTFLAWRFPIEMLMKSDDSRTSRDAVIRDGDVGDVATILLQLLTADCAPSRFLTIANFASSNYTWGSHCIFAEQARVHWI